MRIFVRSLIVFSSLTMLGIVSTASCWAQTPRSTVKEVAEASAAASTATKSVAVNPLFTNYRGIAIGMAAEDVRNQLDHLKEQGKMQDFFVFSEQESAQVFYDKDGKVSAISIDYVGSNSNAPSAKDVLGGDVQAKADGSMYDLRRYPKAGYWVAYNRTAGNDPIITITMQKLN